MQEHQGNKPASNVIGQKSEKALVEAAARKKRKGRSIGNAAGDKDAKISYSKSGGFFRRMQEQKEAAAVALVPSASHATADGLPRKKAAALKL